MVVRLWALRADRSSFTPKEIPGVRLCLRMSQVSNQLENPKFLSGIELATFRLKHAFSKSSTRGPRDKQPGGGGR
jgi:hypothetical protein